MRQVKEFLLASSNEHKALEFNELFKGSDLLIKSAPLKLDVLENGQDFHENALIKAKAYFNKFKQPVLADDSGLEVEALPTELGIYSARFGGEGLSDQQRYELLLSKMDAVKNRDARFVCVLCFYQSEGEVFFFEGQVKGQIGYRPMGKDGFGYDPIFYPEGNPGMSMAQDPKWKLLNSHRAAASLAAMKFFT